MNETSCIIISCWSLEFIKRSSQENRTENKKDQDPKAHRPSQTYTVLDVASNKTSHSSIGGILFLL